MSRIFLVFCTHLLLTSPTLAQDLFGEKIDFHTENVTYVTVIRQITEAHGVRIFYNPDFFGNLRMPTDFFGETVQELVDGIAQYQELNVVQPDPHSVVFTYQGRPRSPREPHLSEIQKEPDVIIESSTGEKKLQCVLTGFLTDAQTGLPIPGGYVRTEKQTAGTPTDANGRYQLTLPAGTHTLIYSALGYTDEPRIIRISYDGRLNVEIYESVIRLSDLIFTGEKDNDNILNTKMGTELLEIETLKKLPSLLGEADIVKSVELLPGVTSVGEGSAGYNVRGGGVDQNLVLLEGSPIFNYSHFLGFFSAFNPDVVKDVSFYRGYIPARYGGRLSSVLDIALRDGNYKSFSGKGGIGLASSSVLIEGPIQRDTTSFFLAGRSTYSDWLLDNFNDPNVQNSNVSFHDINARVTHKLDWSKQITANFYYSRDRFSFLNDTIYHWQTLAINLQYRQAFKNNWALQSSVGKGQYRYLVNEPQPFQAFDLEYLIDHYSTSHHLSYDRSAFSATAGMEGTYYNVNSGSLTGGEQSQVKDFTMPESRAADLALFLEGELEVNDNLRVSAGLRFSNFIKFSTDSVFTYRTDAPKSLNTVSDTLLPSGDPEKIYYGLEPRIGVTYVLSNETSLKFSYTRTFQYIHLLSNTTSITPLDIWQTSGYHIKPQVANQVSVGLYQNFDKNRYEASVETYYKTMDQVLEYKNGASLILNRRLETDLLQGKGMAYGLEMQVKKATGKLTGWVSYTYSRTFTQVNGAFREEQLNRGHYFPANYDKPLNLKMFGSYKFNHRITLNWNFQYSTGRPITVPVSKYQVDDVVISNYSDRNTYRIPDYHRLDLALDIFPNHKIHKVFESYWTLGLYNVYFRRNAYSVFFEDNGTSPVARQLSVLGIIFPSVSYNFKF